MLVLLVKVRMLTCLLYTNVFQVWYHVGERSVGTTDAEHALDEGFGATLLIRHLKVTTSAALGPRRSPRRPTIAAE